MKHYKLLKHRCNMLRRIISTSTLRQQSSKFVVQVFVFPYISEKQLYLSKYDIYAKSVTPTDSKQSSVYSRQLNVQT